jgi:hypothetical protein
MSIVVLDFRPMDRNTLRGFAKIEVQKWGIVINDVALHDKLGRRWAQLPSTPQIQNGAVMKDATGKAQYKPMFSFKDKSLGDQFSRAVWDAVDAFVGG